MIGVLPMVSRTLLYFMEVFPCGFVTGRMVIRFAGACYSFFGMDAPVLVIGGMRRSGVRCRAVIGMFFAWGLFFGEG